MKKSWSWGLLEKSTVSRQQRTSIRGSVKTSASEELERKTFYLSLLFLLVFVLDRCCLISWQTSLCRTPQRDIFSNSLIENLLTLPKLDVQMECSRLSSSRPGREDWSLGSEVTAVGFLKATFCGCGEACLQTKNSQTVWLTSIQSQCTVEIQGGGFSVASFTCFFLMSHLF